MCTTGPFNMLSIPKLTKVSISCMEGVWMHEVQNKFYLPFDFEHLSCGRSKSNEVCCDLPPLANGDLNGKGCATNAIDGQQCTFTCARNLVASPSSKDDCALEEGVIECVNGQWQKPLCIEPKKKSNDCPVVEEKECAIKDEPEPKCPKVKVDRCAKKETCTKKLSPCETKKRATEKKNNKCKINKVCKSEKTSNTCKKTQEEKSFLLLINSRFYINK